MPDISKAANQLAADSDALSDAADLVPLVVPGVDGNDKGRAHTLVEFAKRILARLTTADLGSGDRNAGTILFGDGVFRALVFPPPAPSPFSTTDTFWEVSKKPNGILTLTRSLDLRVVGSSDNEIYTLLVRQDADGGNTLGFPDDWKWRDGTEEAIATGGGEETLITIRRISGTIYAAPLMKNLS